MIRDGRRGCRAASYNRSVRFHHLPVPVLVAVLAALAGCGRGVQNEAAVRQGVLDYLGSRADLNVSSMQVDVTSVSFRQDEADATVSFRPKGGAVNSGMQMRYTLTRQGSRWVVKGKGAGHGEGSAQPGAGMQMPPNHPSMGGAAPGQLPEAQKK